jgi:glutathione S-transferase
LSNHGVCIFVRKEDTLVWSMPVWIFCVLKNIPISLLKSESATPSTFQERRHLSPLVKIDGLMVSELIAIFETLHELYPDDKIWPKEKVDRAVARDVCAQIVRICSGASPFILNLGESRVCVDIDFLERLFSLSQGACRNFNSSVLFGEFCAADAAAILLPLTGVSGLNSPMLSKYFDMAINSVVVGDWLGTQPVVERSEHFSKLIAWRRKSSCKSKA